MVLFDNYKRYPIVIKKARGSFVFDRQGKRYLDFSSGISVCNFGHIHPRIKSKIRSQLDKIWHASNIFRSPLQEKAASKICRALNMEGSVYFANSGTEANEAAIKLARKFTGKDGVISFENSFHGRTFGSMSATGQDKIKKGFGSMLNGFYHARYNDIDHFLEVIQKASSDGVQVGAAIVEIIQAEGGVNVASYPFIKELSSICREREILLIVDEIQTGIGRCGSKFAFQNHGIKPDIVTMAKALGNGIPIGAMFAQDRFHSTLDFGSHGSTFGGNCVAMAACCAVMKLLNNELLEGVRQKSEILINALESIDSDRIVSVRGCGLLIGIEFNFPVQGLISKLLDENLITLSAGQGNVLRLLPPLVVSNSDLISAAAIIEKTLKSINAQKPKGRISVKS